jgi:hypothetical protein
VRLQETREHGQDSFGTRQVILAGQLDARRAGHGGGELARRVMDAGRAFFANNHLYRHHHVSGAIKGRQIAG